MNSRSLAIHGRSFGSPCEVRDGDEWCARGVRDIRCQRVPSRGEQAANLPQAAACAVAASGKGLHRVAAIRD
jgi:hypothetical protein